MEEPRRYIPVLTIAGSDPSGGAGIQADLKTISALGCYGESAITAITVQNTVGVELVEPMDAETVAGQIRAVMDDIEPKAIKTGMTGNGYIIRAISRTLKEYKAKGWKGTVVVDPVMVSTSGNRLMEEDALEVLKGELLPLATLITPNIPEAEALSGISLGAQDGRSVRLWMDEAARKMAKETGSAVLIKGGHLEEGDKTDRLYDQEGRMWEELSSGTITTRNTHGTGCTLSAAIASMAARGMELREAVGEAKKWLTEALRSGSYVEIGRGKGPVDHFFSPIASIKVICGERK